MTIQSQTRCLIAMLAATLPAAAAVGASPASLAFSYNIGGAVPTGQTLSLTSTGAEVAFTAVSSPASGTTWLRISPASGTTPGSISVSVNTAGLAANTYQGSVTITPVGAGNAPLIVPVTLTVVPAGAPSFSASGVLNAIGYQNKLAPDTIFVVFGSAMGPSALASAAGPNYPSSVGGTTVTFTPATGGAAVSAKMLYSVAGQIAGLLPSSITPGTYAVRVAYNGVTSAPQNVSVVARSFGIATANSAGSGTAQATIGNVNSGVSLVRFTSGSVAFNGLDWALTPAHPGDTLVLWGTGGGADAANDTGGTSGDQTKAGNFIVTVGGRQITPLYAGASSGYPGLWQINFTLPGDIAPDCFASAQVTAGGESSNPVTIPIAAAGQAACSDSELSKEVLAKLDSGANIYVGGYAITKTNLTTTIVTNGVATKYAAMQELMSGDIGKYTPAEYAVLRGLPRYDACTVSNRTATAFEKNPAAPDGWLDAGASIPVSGPGLAPNAAMTIPNLGVIHALLLTNGTIVGGGKYSFSAPGGKDLMPFNASVVFPSNFTATNFDAISVIDRSKPLNVTWSGTNLDQVYVTIGSYEVVGKDAANNFITHNVVVTCQVDGGLGSYTVPAAALAFLPTATLDSVSLATRSASFSVQTATHQFIDAQLVGGGKVDIAAFTSILSFAKNLVVQ